jgi:hypothetical protein
MGYCENCDEYFNKIPAGRICKKCLNDLCGTPPGMNNFEMRYQKELEKRKKNEAQMNKFYTSASLLDLAAVSILKDNDELNTLIKFLPEGHPPWYSLLKAWFFVNKLSSNSIAIEKSPKAQFLSRELSYR